ncbi:MAG TPA: hypothetical protein VF039_13785 [Longimicrobiales bacterium]
MWKSFLYWTGALGLVLGLMVSITGIAAYLESTGRPVHVVLGVFFAVVGCILLIFAFVQPKALWKSHFRAPDPDVDDRLSRSGAEEVAAAYAEFLGLGLIVAGTVYAASDELLVVLGAWAIIGLSGVVGRYLR